MAKDEEKEMTTEELERHVVGFAVNLSTWKNGKKQIQLLPLSYFGVTEDGMQDDFGLDAKDEIIGVIPWARDLPKYPKKKAKKS